MDSTHYAPPYENAFFRYYMREDGIQYYEVSDIRRDVVDEWVRIVTANDQVSVARDEMALSMYCVRDAWPTPYMAAQMSKSARETPTSINQRMAVVIADSFLANIFSMFLRSMPSWAMRDLRFFTAQADALDWLTTERERVEGVRAEVV